MNDEILKIETGNEGENRNIDPADLGALRLRRYQEPIFRDHKSGIVVLHWARQVGKSYVLAAWAVYRLIENPGRLVTVLSNSRENGAEFLRKAAEICNLMNAPIHSIDSLDGNMNFEDMRMELRMQIKGKLGRIKVLAANPRTARGFSGDLILDEFAFHEDSAAIWAAAEPILSSNEDFRCRIASTGNGHHNMFFRMVNEGSLMVDGWKEFPPEHQLSSIFKVSRLTRTKAYELGTRIYHPQTRKPITPEQARALALDKRTYDQNFECSFADESLTLLTHQLITEAERDNIGKICEQDWTADALEFLRYSGHLYAGFDVGRKNDLSVITVLDMEGNTFRVRGILRMRDMRLPEQELRLGALCKLPNFQRVALDLTGLGLGLFEYAQKSFGGSRILGINFASSVPVKNATSPDGSHRETIRITESLAMDLLRVYEDRRIQHPREDRLRDDLRKPEKITSPGGRVSIAATRDEAGHADHFWSLALAIYAAGKGPVSFGKPKYKMPTPWERIKFPNYDPSPFRRERRILL